MLNHPINGFMDDGAIATTDRSIICPYRRKGYADLIITCFRRWIGTPLLTRPTLNNKTLFRFLWHKGTR